MLPWLSRSKEDRWLPLVALLLSMFVNAATNTVMSSITSSLPIAFQRSNASFASAVAASSGESHAATTATASSLETNSQMPSVATMTNLSCSTISCVRISGSGVTPTLCAMESPKLLDMDKPGTHRFFIHTRNGPSPNSPTPAELTPPRKEPSAFGVAINRATRPSMASILLLSAGNSGLWSHVSASASILPFCTSRPSTALESPTHAHVMRRP